MLRVPMRLRDVPPELNALSGVVLDSCIEVHRSLGRWLLEASYRDCLAHELTLRGVEVDVERAFQVDYKGISVRTGYRVDLLVGGRLVVEVKAVPTLTREHEAQLMNYLALAGAQLGILVNFQAPLIREGFLRRALSPMRSLGPQDGAQLREASAPPRPSACSTTPEPPDQP